MLPLHVQNHQRTPVGRLKPPSFSLGTPEEAGLAERAFKFDADVGRDERRDLVTEAKAERALEAGADADFFNVLRRKLDLGPRLVDQLWGDAELIFRLGSSRQFAPDRKTAPWASHQWGAKGLDAEDEVRAVGAR